MTLSQDFGLANRGLSCLPERDDGPCARSCFAVLTFVR